jgi:hypothetical protein
MRMSEPASSSRDTLLSHELKPVEDRQQRARQRVDWYRCVFSSFLMITISRQRSLMD